MGRLSFTLSGGLGDFILSYLGFPGKHLQAILHQFGDIDYRICTAEPSAVDLVVGHPGFSGVEVMIHDQDDHIPKLLPNDISLIKNLHIHHSAKPRLHLDQKESAILRSIKGPYGVYHPFSSKPYRSLSSVFDIVEQAQMISYMSGLPIVVLGSEDFGYESGNVKQFKGSSRLSVSIVERASFFVGSHSSMQCAAWVHDVPSMCLAPQGLLGHEITCPGAYEKYLRPLFDRANIFLEFEMHHLFTDFLSKFLSDNVSTTRLVAERRRGRPRAFRPVL